MVFRVRDRSGKPTARHERGLAADSPAPMDKTSFPNVVFANRGHAQQKKRFFTITGVLGQSVWTT
jgi:hypothetical protein